MNESRTAWPNAPSNRVDEAAAVEQLGERELAPGRLLQQRVIRGREDGGLHAPQHEVDARGGHEGRHEADPRHLLQRRHLRRCVATSRFCGGGAAVLKFRL